MNGEHWMLDEKRQAAEQHAEKKMLARTCGNCRWWQYAQEWGGKSYGHCHRRAPLSDTEWPGVYGDRTCGEWADAATTPEQDERRELVRRFAIGLTSGAVYESSIDPTVKAVWMIAQAMADAEPKL